MSTARRVRHGMAARIDAGGFTLIEMMIVVAIIAILAVVAVVAYNRHIQSSRVIEAHELLSQIQMRQESYYQTNGVYCNASGGSQTFHPVLATSFTDQEWNPAGASLPGWGQLGVRVEKGRVYFSYVAVAGVSPAFALAGDAAALGITAGTPWYYAIARADMDGNGSPYTELSVTSVRRQVIEKNKGQ